VWQPVAENEVTEIFVAGKENVLFAKRDRQDHSIAQGEWVIPPASGNIMPSLNEKCRQPKRKPLIKKKSHCAG
jgi:hypothetical protein